MDRIFGEKIGGFGKENTSLWFLNQRLIFNELYRVELFWISKHSYGIQYQTIRFTLTYLQSQSTDFAPTISYIPQQEINRHKKGI